MKRNINIKTLYICSQKPVAGKVISPIRKAIAVLLFNGHVCQSYCLIKNYVYDHRLVLLSSLVEEATFSSVSGG